MSAQPPDRPTGRGTTLQEELLEDLRGVGPVLAVPTAVAKPVPTAVAKPVPAATPEPGRTPTVAVRVTPLRWSPFSVEAGHPLRQGVTLSAGPLRISVSGFGD
jgi:hypothetical protein